MLKARGTEHLSVATCHHDIGTVYAAKGDKEAAMASLLKAKAIREKKLGLKHPETQKTQEYIDKLTP
jgi:hypothetical protein